jgi:hypothetical protein
MSQSLRERLPAGFLKKSYGAWSRLDPSLQYLIVELAKSQHFKCAFCSEDHGLIIEHDHDPYQGDWKRPTIHNTRGLTCERCNRHLWLYEKDESGEYRAWDHVSPDIQSDDYTDYIYHYENRIRRLHEDFLEETCPNYWNRKPFLDKFDGWKDGWERHYPWYWGFDEIKEQRYGKIRNPKQFLRGVLACMTFVLDEKKKDPNFQPPETFFQMMYRLKPLFETARRIVEAEEGHSVTV